MTYFLMIAKFTFGFLFFLFLVSLVKFYFYRKRQLDKVKIVEFILTSGSTISTYNIHQNVFKDKTLSYVAELLSELESECIIKQVNIGHLNGNNGLWEYVQKL